MHNDQICVGQFAEPDMVAHLMAGLSPLTSVMVDPIRHRCSGAVTKDKDASHGRKSPGLATQVVLGISGLRCRVAHDSIVVV